MPLKLTTDNVQAPALGPDFEAFAADQRSHAASHRWRDCEPTEADSAELERSIVAKWTELEGRRFEAIARRFPKRALEAAQAANESPVIAELRAWAATPADGSGAGSPPRGSMARDGVAVLAGPVGVGKTVAATWWALQQRYAPAFLRAADFAASSRYDRDARERWQSAQGLVLDDLGAEYADAKGSFRVDLDELVDAYYADKRTLVITTNLVFDDFRERYGARIVDRIRECGAWITCSGPSLRRRGEP